MPIIERQYCSLIETIIHQAEQCPNRKVLTFLSEGQAPREISPQHLHADMIRLAQSLKVQGIKVGDVVVLLFSDAYDIAVTFLAAMFIGAIPTICPYAPKLGPSQFNHTDLNRLLQTSLASWLITTGTLVSEVNEKVAEQSCQVLAIDAIETAPSYLPIDQQPYRATPEEVAYLQFSSGTTGTAKGVMISHRAVLNHINAAQQATDYQQRDVSVSWIPLHHDMGLMSQLLMPLCLGGSAVLLSARDWMLNPKSLLWAIHHYHGTFSCMPNFGFQHTMRLLRDQDLAGLDLSSWRVLISGGESVSYETLSQFQTRLMPYGLQPNVLAAAYGLAENVAAIACVTAQTALKVDWVSTQELLQNRAALSSPQAQFAKALVSCGAPMPGTTVEVVDTHGRLCPERAVGEIRVQGSSLFTGYYNRPDLTAAVMRDGWLYTGDLGYLSEGQLYICGRKKELIIVGGQNIYPDSIETIAQSVLGETAGHLVAFGLPDPHLGTEMPILVCEYRRHYDTSTHEPIIQRIRQQVQQDLNLTLADVRLVRRGWVRVTTSGKVSRTAARDKYLADSWQPERLELPQQPDSVPKSLADIERLLTQMVVAATGLETIDLHKPLHELGVESLLLVQILTQAETILGCQIPLENLALQPTLHHLAHIIYEHMIDVNTPDSQSRINTHPDKPFSAGLLETSSLDAYPPSIPQEGIQSRQLHSVLASALNRLPRFGMRSRLSYGASTQILRAAVCQPLIQQTLYAQEAQLVRQCLAEIPTKVDPETVLCQSLMVNTWPVWRRAKLSHPATFRQWVRFRGETVLHDLAVQKRGVVIAFPHTPLKSLLRHLPILQMQDHNKDFVVIGNLSATSLAAQGMTEVAQAMARGETLSKTVVRSAQLMAALRVLRSGGIAIVLADDNDGTGGIQVPFHGRLRYFRPGAAELALQTNAAFVPLFATMALSGQVTFDCLEPLVPAGKTHAEKLQSLLFQYATILVSRYQTDLGAMEWFILRKFLATPSLKYRPMQEKDLVKKSLPYYS